jgi:hypothetical protein
MKTLELPLSRLRGITVTDRHPSKSIAGLSVFCEENMAEAQKARNQSEILFETYLKQCGITKWDYEPEVEGKSHRLDYRLSHKGQAYFFDVKEFREEARESALEQAGGAFDPYSPIRNKIHATREQFSDYKEFPCSL